MLFKTMWRRDPLLTLLVALILGLTASNAHALGNWWGLHIGSYHAPNNSAYNNANGGFYVRQADGLTYGSYRNSYYKDTVYVGQTISYKAVDLLFAVAAGYPQRPLTPVVVPSVKLWQGHDQAFRLAVLPAVLGQRAGAVFHVTYEHRY